MKGGLGGGGMRGEIFSWKKKEVCSVRVGFQQHFASARQAKSSLVTKTDSMKGKQVYSRHNGATH